MTTYVSVKLDTNNGVSIVSRLKTIGFKKAAFIKVKELHTTLMYAQNIDLVDSLEFDHLKTFKATISDIAFWEGHDKAGYVVMILDSNQLQHEHRRLKTLGLIHSFDDYVPHITLFTGEDARELYDKIDKIKKVLVGMSVTMVKESAERIRED